MKHRQHCGRVGLRTPAVLGALVVMLLASTASPRAALADPPASAPAADAQKRAKAHFAKGKAFQDKDDFEHAIIEYRAAYALIPLPDLIFNIAQCERLNGDKRAALDDFQRYLVVAPDGRGAGEARTFVAALGPEVSEAERRQKEQKEKDEQARRDSEAQARQQAEVAAQLAAQARREQQERETQEALPRHQTDAIVAGPAPAPQDRGPILRLSGLITAGVGAALIAGGIIYRFKSGSDEDGLNKLGMVTQDGPKTWDQALYDSYQTDKTMTYLLLGIGGAAIVGGGVMYFLGRRTNGERPTIAVAPAPLLGGAALTFTLSLR